MGAWGYNIFENDDAVDSIYEMMESDVEVFMNESFESAEDSDYLELEDCYRIVVSAAVIDMILNDTSYSDLDMDEFMDWFEELRELNLIQYVIPAAKGLDRVLSDDSELKELWEENEELYDKWEQSISELLNRLK